MKALNNKKEEIFCLIPVEEYPFNYENILYLNIRQRKKKEKNIFFFLFFKNNFKTLFDAEEKAKIAIDNVSVKFPTGIEIYIYRI